jgi:sialidase-1
MSHRKAAILAAAVLIAVAVVDRAPTSEAATAVSHSEKLLFDGGGGEVLNGLRYHSFRIPSLVATHSADHTLLAFAEGRAADNFDYGNINLVYKRSTDNGKTWSPLRQVVGAGAGTWGNPTAVVDASNNKVWLFMSWNPAGFSQSGSTGTTKITQWDERKVYVTSSADDGLTWATPTDVTEQTKPKTRGVGTTWAWDAVGPGVGIQLTVGEHAGRLVIPAISRDIYSDDHGATWTYQLIANKDTGALMQGTSESTVLQLSDGSLYRNDRASAYWDDDLASTQRRWVSRGTIEDGFSAYVPDARLLDPKSEGSTMRYNTDAPSRVVFLNSASTTTRTKMEVKVSNDEAKTWPCYRTLSDAPLPAWAGLGTGNVKEGGYSSLARVNDYNIGALVEVNENADSSSTSHRSIVFRKFNLPWIFAGPGTCS